MRVTGAELREIRLPLREAFVTQAGARKDRRILLLRVLSEESGAIGGSSAVEGWGECVAGETDSYTSETTDTAWEALATRLLPSVIGREILAPEEILHPIGAGDPMARATLDMAVWDLMAREQGVPLWELLGGTGEPVAVGAVVGIERDLDTLIERVRRLVSRGYSRIKLKVEPGWEVEPTRAVRAAFPGLALGVDANGSYDGEDPALSELDRLGLAMIEQPLAAGDLRGHARLQARMETPLALDESIDSVETAVAALELGACRVVNVKPGRVGGLAEARAIHDLCREAGTPAWCGGMLESGIGRAHALALATLPGFTVPADLSESARYWERDIVDPEFVLQGGRLALPRGDGIGVRPDVDRIRSLTVRRISFGRGFPAGE